MLLASSSFWPWLCHARDVLLPTRRIRCLKSSFCFISSCTLAVNTWVYWSITTESSSAVVVESIGFKELVDGDMMTCCIELQFAESHKRRQTDKTRKVCCQYVPRQPNGWLGYPVKKKQVIIKDTELVPAKDPPILKLVNLFEEISNMYCSFNCVTYLLFMALYIQLRSKCEVYRLLLALCLSWEINGLVMVIKQLIKVSITVVKWLIKDACNDFVTIAHNQLK